MMNGFLRWLMASDDEPNWRAKLAALEPPIIDGEAREPRLRVLYAAPDGREKQTDDLPMVVAVTLMRGSGHYDS